MVMWRRGCVPVLLAAVLYFSGIAGRRRGMATEVFRQQDKTRGGLGGTNSGLKRRVGLGRLRVRGRPAVFHVVYLKVAGWNILRLVVCARMREIVWERADMAAF